MDATVVVAGMGFAATLLGAWLTANWQRKGDREGRILDAKVRVYGDCSNDLYEYARATYDRGKARLASLSDGEREQIRQEAYRCNARARSAIGQAAILSGNEDVEVSLSAARRAISDMNDARDYDDLRRRQEEAHGTVKQALDVARSELMD